MRTPFIVAAAVSAFAATASAAPVEAPYVLRATHADFGMQLGEVAATPGEIGAAALAAADLLAPHVAAEERVVLPLLGLAPALADGEPVSDARDVLARADALRAELPWLAEAKVEIVSALAGLFAAGDAAGRPEIARLADRMIWHELGDLEILYPAAALVGAAIQARMAEASVPAIAVGPAPLYGREPVPMMGLGSPHR